jgi:hypothetical protein
MQLSWECEKVKKLLAFARTVQLAELTKPTPPDALQTTE